MMVEKLGGIESLKNLQSTQKIQKSARSDSSDYINLSTEAQKMSEVYLAMEAVKAAPDVRREKVDEVTKKLQDPAYIDGILDQTADKILDAFGF